MQCHKRPGWCSFIIETLLWWYPANITMILSGFLDMKLLIAVRAALPKLALVTHQVIGLVDKEHLAPRARFRSLRVFASVQPEYSPTRSARST